MALNGTFRSDVSLTNSKDGVDLSTPVEYVNQFGTQTIDSGYCYHNTITVTTSAFYDLMDGTLLDVFGQSITLSSVTGLYVKAGASNTGPIVLSGSSSIITLPPLAAGESFVFAGDLTLTSGSVEGLEFHAGGTSGTVDIVVTGD